MTKQPDESFEKVTSQQRYRALFVNQDKESKKIRQLLEKHKIEIKAIIVKDQKDVPRLVTSERVFLGISQIKEYINNWARLEKILAAK